MRIIASPEKSRGEISYKSRAYRDEHEPGLELIEVCSVSNLDGGGDAQGKAEPAAIAAALILRGAYRSGHAERTGRFYSAVEGPGKAALGGVVEDRDRERDSTA